MDDIFLVVLVFILTPLIIIALVVNTVHIVHEETKGTTYDMFPGQRVIDYFPELILSAGAIFFTAALVKVIIELFF